ncbi:MAG: ribosomal protein S18-alanine N-acetyltransferase [Sporomusaceae bacterium]|nr:ribosomal protein S18-alanine N-acetyltransferase [Sporomusaceae bacterium]
MDKLNVRSMTEQDIDGVLAIEEVSFSEPWSRVAFEAEVAENDLAYYLVVEKDGEIAAYAGTWLILDEAHVTNVAVLPKYRQQGIGAVILKTLIERVKAQGAVRMTLEVRTSNTAAQNLYKNFGFEAKGIRKKYYSDTGEDAIIMWVDL